MHVTCGARVLYVHKALEVPIGLFMTRSADSYGVRRVKKRKKRRNCTSRPKKAGNRLKLVLDLEDATLEGAMLSDFEDSGLWSDVEAELEREKARQQLELEAEAAEEAEQLNRALKSHHKSESMEVGHKEVQKEPQAAPLGSIIDAASAVSKKSSISRNSYRTALMSSATAGLGPYAFTRALGWTGISSGGPSALSGLSLLMFSAGGRGTLNVISPTESMGSGILDHTVRGPGVRISSYDRPASNFTIRSADSNNWSTFVEHHLGPDDDSLARIMDFAPPAVLPGLVQDDATYNAGVIENLRLPTSSKEKLRMLLDEDIMGLAHISVAHCRKCGRKKAFYYCKTCNKKHYYHHHHYHQRPMIPVLEPKKSVFFENSEDNDECESEKRQSDHVAPANVDDQPSKPLSGFSETFKAISALCQSLSARIRNFASEVKAQPSEEESKAKEANTPKNIEQLSRTEQSSSSLSETPSAERFVEKSGVFDCKSEKDKDGISQALSQIETAKSTPERSSFDSAMDSRFWTQKCQPFPFIQPTRMEAPTVYLDRSIQEFKTRKEQESVTDIKHREASEESQNLSMRAKMLFKGFQETFRRHRLGKDTNVPLRGINLN